MHDRPAHFHVYVLIVRRWPSCYVTHLPGPSPPPLCLPQMAQLRAAVSGGDRRPSLPNLLSLSRSFKFTDVATR